MAIGPKRAIGPDDLQRAVRSVAAATAASRLVLSRWFARVNETLCVFHVGRTAADPLSAPALARKANTRRGSEHSSSRPDRRTPPRRSSEGEKT